jgi:hypothetical protein
MASQRVSTGVRVCSGVGGACLPCPGRDALLNSRLQVCRSAEAAR